MITVIKMSTNHIKFNNIESVSNRVKWSKSMGCAVSYDIFPNGSAVTLGISLLIKYEHEA